MNLRAGQDSGFFFLYETVAALTYAGDLRLDVVNMSFFTDPWLYNCDSRDDYVSGAVTPEEIAEQALIRQRCERGIGVRVRPRRHVGGLGRQRARQPRAPTRFDATSPDFPPGTARDATVTDNCLVLPAEARR